MKAFSPVLFNDRTLQPALSCFLRDRAMWIDSEEVESAGSATFDRYGPAHGALVTRAPRGTAADADRSIAAARKTFDLGTWPKMTASERAGVLLKTADLIDRDRELLADLDSLESGKAISQARGGVAGAADIWRYAASRIWGGRSSIARLPTIPKKKRFTFTKVRARTGGSRGPEANQKDREPARLRERRRTESGGRVRLGR